MFTQTAFGIVFSSYREFRELAAVADDVSRESIATIHWGNVPSALREPTLRDNWWQTTASEYLLHVPDLARFYVTVCGITVQPEPAADDTAVRLYLFGSVMAALLHLRGVLPLHGSAVFVSQAEGATVFTGAPTAGKSTLAAALVRRGYTLMADDVCAVRASSDRLLLHPGIARCKLWRKSADFLSLDIAKAAPVRQDKYSFEMATARQAAVITHIYELKIGEGEGVAIKKVEGAEKLRLLDRQTFRRNYIGGFGRSGAHLHSLAKLAGQCQISQITRPAGEKPSMNAIMDLLEQDWSR